MNDVLVILKLGRARIAQGWIQGAFVRSGPDGGYCALGACGFMDGVRPDTHLTYTMHECWNRLTAQAPPEFRIEGQGIARYNNDPATTQADILGCFDRAIQAEELAIFNAKINVIVKETQDASIRVSPFYNDDRTAGDFTTADCTVTSHYNRGQGSLTVASPIATETT